MPVWEPASRPPASSPPTQLGPPHRRRGRRPEQFLFRRPGPRRHHPDPLPVLPERRLARRRVPVARPRRSSCSRASSASRPELEAREEEAIRQRLYGIAGSTRLPRPEAPRGRAGDRPRAGARRERGLERPMVMGSARPAWRRRPSRRSRPDRRARRRARSASDGSGARQASTVVGATAGAPTIALPRPSPETLGAGPPAPVRPARAQRLVLGAVGRPAHLAVRRPDPPGRPGRGRVRR